MIQQLKNLIKLFSLEFSNFIIKEEYDEVVVECQCSQWKTTDEKTFSTIVHEVLNDRDLIHITVLDEYDSIASYKFKENDFDKFNETCKNSMFDENFNLRIVIEKKVVANRISIYSFNDFIKSLNDKNIRFKLDILTRLFTKEQLTFELQDLNFPTEFYTKTISFVNKGNSVKFENIFDREIKLEKIKNLCHNNISSNYSFIPDDFHIVKSTSEELNSIFNQLNLIYSLCFIFDIVLVDEDKNSIFFKLNGYKSLSNNISLSDVNLNDCTIYYKIYQWIYTEGNTEDKLGLSRNIISLNFDKNNLSLSENTYDAVQSGFKIYQKQNIKQYIEIRNKISEQLIELRNKADIIVSSFINDYKKSLFAIVSFFISVIVIRVISQGDIAGAFTIEVTMLSIGFLIVSLLVMKYSLWEIKKHTERYREYYNNLKERYEDLLNKSDIERILNEDKDFNSNINFIEERKKLFTYIWCASVIVLFIIVIILFCYNNVISVINFKC